MNSPIIIIGIGELGSVLARGFLRTSYPVYPVTREMDIKSVSESIKDPEAVIIAVGESALEGILKQIPDNWKSKLILIQNELLPQDWQKFGLNPTVVSIWFEKKKGQDVKVVVPSPIFGENAQLLSKALSKLDIPNFIVQDLEQMTFELVRKNYYILTTNIAGLKVAGTVSELWGKNKELGKRVALDVHAIQQSLVGEKLDHEKLLDAMLEAFDGDPDHGCMGRSAPARLERALKIADDADIEVPALTEINNTVG